MHGAANASKIEATITASDMGALRDQTAFNIRERAGRRKQKAVRCPDWRSKRIRCLFGIGVRLECPRGLEGRYRLAPLVLPRQ